MAGTRRTISIDELDNFQIDPDRMLYWDGEAVQTLAKYNLPWWINASIILGGLGGFAAGMGSLIEALSKAHLI